MLAFCAFTPSLGQGVYALKQVNTPYDEQQPVLSAQEELFLSVAFHPENTGGSRDYGDVWYSKKDEFNQWQAAKPVASLSTEGYDLFIGFPDDQTALVYHDGKKKPHGIHLYRRTGETDWKYEYQLDFGSFKNNGKSFSARLHPSGEILVMAMNTYGTFGNEDIYVSFKQSEGKWSVPKNIGADVNSFEQEMTPFLSDDRQVLYFSSNGHGTGEGRDIYYSQRLDDSWERWSKPKMLQDDINSRGVELSYFIDPNSPYTAFVTTTQNSEGYGDILMRRKEEIVLEEVTPVEDERFLAANFPVSDRSSVSVTNAAEVVPETPEEPKVPETPAQPTIEEERPAAVSEEQGQEVEIAQESAAVQVEEAKNVEEVPMAEAEEEQAPSMDAARTNSMIKVSALDKNTNAEIPYKITFKNANGDKLGIDEGLKGAHELALRENTAKVTVSSENYLPETILVTDFRDKELVMLTPADKGTSLVLQEVLFKKGTAELADQNSLTYIDQLVDFMKENPSKKIRLEGHTDNVGNAALNKQLSMERAGSIRDYMVDHGVAFERIMLRGLGGSEPIADNNTAAGREKNRRVEMVVID
ncbi:outer membrane protein/peptidoglycan-associated (lipo)protein [Echinicola vietnamensis DSM 17526]|uniref:Outer membrane protein/peptidoglycan-associated (Lipo)protein n=1 Tax=Echinicola vietnamensis (strain DSM 17526 / LMG 23754 / KMM 6221) TaxID=926556 RepID=L0G3H2_ECHVK|nr:outer membrane protein/peptidoglycan-associated (lipo)protein [Echinicola vietnamensis DSM 17526]